MIPASLRLLALPEAIRFGWALVHFLWQGAVIVALLEVALVLAGRANAALRYIFCGLALALMPVCLTGTYIFLGGGPHQAPALAQPSNSSAVVSVAETAVPPTSTYPTFRDIMASPAQEALPLDLDPYMPAVVTAWFVGVVVLGGRKAGGLYVVWRLRHLGLGAPTDALQEQFRRICLHMGVNAERVVLKISSFVTVPMTMGWLAPVVLLPACLLSGLTPEEIELLLAHELAHIRRHDYLANILQTVVETIFFYHPAAWWLSRRMRQERENACDDLISTGPAETLAYAKILVLLETRRSAGSWLVSGANGGNLLHRIQRLAGERARSPLSGFAATVATAGLLAVVAVASLIRAQESRPSEASPVMSADEAKAKGIAALVDQIPITWADVDSHPNAILFPDKPKAVGEARRQQILQVLIDRELIIEKCRRDGLKMSREFADVEVNDQIKRNYGSERNRFLQHLKDEGSSLEKYEQEIIAGEMVAYEQNKNVWRVAGDYYQDHLDLFPMGDKINISVIAIESPAPSADTADDLPDKRPEAQLAREILTKVRAGADFRDYSRKYHDMAFDRDRSYWVTNTRTGFSGIPGYLPVTWAVLSKMQAGQTTDVLTVEALSPKGARTYYIVRVNDRRPALVSSAAESEREDAVLNAEVQRVARQWLDSLRSNTSIQRFDAPAHSIAFPVSFVDAGQMLTIRTFLAPPNFFQNSGIDDMKQQLSERGIRFPADASAQFLPESGKIIVRNTPEQLDLIANLIEQFVKNAPSVPATIAPSTSTAQPVASPAIAATQDVLDKALILEARDPAREFSGQGKTQQEKVAAIEKLLQQGANPNAKDESGNTALTWALNYGSDNVAEVLIEHGADGNAEDKSGENAAWLAASLFYCPNALELMIKKGVKVTAVDKGGENILHHMSNGTPLGPSHPSYFNGVAYSETAQRAYEAREHRTVDLLVAAGAHLNGKDGNQGWGSARTPLMAVLQSQKFEAARAMIDHGADLALKDSGGNTALAYLFNWGDFSPLPTNIIESMLARGVDPNSPIIPLGDKQVDAIPAMEMALARCPYAPLGGVATLRKAVAIFLRHGASFQVGDDKIQALLKAAAQDDLKSVQAIVQQGTSINSADGHGWTALNVAAALGYGDCGQWLLSQGADATIRANNWSTAFQLAAKSGQADLLDALAAKGPKPNPDASGALYDAAKNRDQRVFDVLIKAGADPKKLDLFVCLENGQVAMAKAALDAGADPNRGGQLPNNQNLAFWAVQKNQPEILKALLDHGADASPNDPHGALAQAKSFHPELVPMLEEAIKRQQNGNTTGTANPKPVTIAQPSALPAAPVAASPANQPASTDAKSALTTKLVNSVNSWGQETEAQNLAEVNDLLAKGADPSAMDMDSRSILFWALAFGKDEVACALIEHGADVNFSYKDCPTAAWVAAWYDYCPKALELLIKKGVAVTGADANGGNILRHAVSRGSLSPKRPSYYAGVVYSDATLKAFEDRRRNVIEQLIAAGVDFNGKDGTETPLMSALGGSRDFTAARILIDHGANVTFKDKDGSNALSYALYWRGALPVEIIQSLLEKGINAKDNVIGLDEGISEPPIGEALGFTEKTTPEEIGALRQTIRLFLDHGATFSGVSDPKLQDLLKAAALGDLKTMQALVQQGASVKTTNGDHFVSLTPLHLSIGLGYADCARWLIGQGAYAPGTDLSTPLQYAVETGRLDILKALLAAGPKPNSEATGVLNYEMARVDQPMIDALIGAGAVPKNLRIIDCIQNGHTALAKAAINAGADPNAQDLVGPRPQSAVHWAVQCNQADVLQALLDHGGNPSAPNAEGKTPLMLAKELHPNLVPILEAALKRQQEGTSGASQLNPSVPKTADAAKPQTANSKPIITTPPDLALATTQPEANVNEPPVAAKPPGTDEPKRQIQLEFKVMAVQETLYQAHKAEIDDMAQRGDVVSLVNLANKTSGIDLLSAPSVTTQDGLKANVDIVREFPYPIDGFKDGQPPPRTVAPLLGNTPPTPPGFKTADLGISIEATPHLIDRLLVDLPIKCDILTLEGWSHPQPGIKQPIFNRNSVQTRWTMQNSHSVICVFGEPARGDIAPGVDAAGGVKVPPAEAPPRRQILIATARVLPVLAAEPRTLVTYHGKDVLIRTSLRIFQISEKTYASQADLIESALRAGDVHLLEQLPGYAMLSGPVIFMKPGEQGTMEASRAVQFPENITRDAGGH